MVEIKHATQVDTGTWPDDPTYPVGSAEWNEAHELLISAAARLVGRVSSGAGPAEELTSAQVQSFLGLATVATTGSYGDLSGLPTLGNSASQDVGTGANTVAAGDDSRISGAQQASEKGQANGYAGLDGDGLVPEAQLPSLAPDIATVADWRSGAAGKMLDAAGLKAASAPVNLPFLASRSLAWTDGAFRTCTLSNNMTLLNPTGVLPGAESVQIWMVGNNATPRSISFGANYRGSLPNVTVSNTQGLLITLTAVTATVIVVTWKVVPL